MNKIIECIILTICGIVLIIGSMYLVEDILVKFALFTSGCIALFAALIEFFNILTK